MRKGDKGPHPLKSRWLSYAIADPALFHATLLVSSIRAPITWGEDIKTKAIVHQNCAVRLINQALESQKQVVGDTTVAAVLALTGYEVSIR